MYSTEDLTFKCDMENICKKHYDESKTSICYRPDICLYWKKKRKFDCPQFVEMNDYIEEDSKTKEIDIPEEDFED